MHQGMSLNKEKLIAAAHKAKGHVATVCKIMGCRNKAVYEWIKFDPDVAEAFEAARDEGEMEEALENMEILKKAYDSIKHLLEERDTTATIFTLKTLGKNRGWDESKKENVNTTESEKFSSLMEMISGLQSARNILDNSINNEQKSE